MHHIRSFLFAALLVAAPAGEIFAQGAPPKGAAQPATTAAPTAQPAPTAQAAAHEIEVDAAMSDKALALFKEGNAHFKQARYPQAHASYTAALALEPRNQKLLRNLGVTELELKRFRDAAEHLAVALRLSDANDPKRPAIEKEVGEARAKVGAINLKVQHAGQELDGVEVVDMMTGKSYKSPFVDPLFVDPGKVSFRIRREGYESQEKVFELKAGGETSAVVTLERPAGFTGPTATATTTSTGPAVAPRSKLPGFIGIGVGAAALIAGGALIGVGYSSRDDMRSKLPRDDDGNSLCPRTAQPGEDSICPDLRSQADSASLMANVGMGLMIGGGVAAAVSVIYLLLPPPKASAAGKSGNLVPVAGKNGGGLVWTGSF